MDNLLSKFSDAEWGKIREELKRNPLIYGLPERMHGSVLAASFNIRKLGNSGTSGRDTATMQFLADVCRRPELYDALESDRSSKAQREYYLEHMPEYFRRLAAGEAVRKPREPAFSPNIDHFLQFIRQPFAVAFQVHGHPGLDTYDFLAVNAHFTMAVCWTGRPKHGHCSNGSYTRCNPVIHRM